MPENTHAVVLAAKNEQALLDSSAKLTAARIPHNLIREPDMANQATALGVWPMPRRLLKKYTSCFPLLRSLQQKPETTAPLGAEGTQS